MRYYKSGKRVVPTSGEGEKHGPWKSGSFNLRPNPMHIINFLLHQLFLYVLCLNWGQDLEWQVDTHFVTVVVVVSGELRGGVLVEQPPEESGAQIGGLFQLFCNNSNAVSHNFSQHLMLGGTLLGEQIPLSYLFYRMELVSLQLCFHQL